MARATPPNLLERSTVHYFGGTSVEVLLCGLNASALKRSDGQATSARFGSASAAVRLAAAVMGLTGLDSIRELRRDRFGWIRNAVAADAHVENDVRHSLQNMLAMLARRLA